MGLLEGRAVVITGSGRGIGAAYARSAAAEGAAVVVNDVDGALADEVVAGIRATGGTALACVADVSDRDGAHQLVATCVREFGAIDGLVNNAGIQVVGAPAAMTEAAIRRVFDVNVLGTIFCATSAMEHMSRAGRGSIVNVTSGAHMGLDAYSIYGASKGAISSLTYCWALDLAATGVRVNAVSPRAATGMAQDMVDSLDLPPAEGAALLDAFPDAAENAPVVVYLLSDRAGHVHGQTVRIDGRALSIVAKPALTPELVAPEWTLDRVVAAFDGELGDRLMPPGLARVAGDFRYETVKSRA